jgi:hypothetical protein
MQSTWPCALGIGESFGDSGEVYVCCGWSPIQLLSLGLGGRFTLGSKIQENSNIK